jgi:hypothetical protein
MGIYVINRSLARCPVALFKTSTGRNTNKRTHMQIKKNNFVVTLKTEKEITDYFGSHIPEEQRLLWLGFFIAHNHIAHRLEQIDESK